MVWSKRTTEDAGERTKMEGRTIDRKESDCPIPSLMDPSNLVNLNLVILLNLENVEVIAHTNELKRMLSLRILRLGSILFLSYFHLECCVLSFPLLVVDFLFFRVAGKSFLCIRY